MSARPIEKVIDMMNRKYAPEANRPYERMPYEKLAGKLGVSKQTLLNWNEDPGKISKEKIDMLMDLSGLDYNNLMRDDDSKISGPTLDEIYESKVSSINQKIEIANRDLSKIENVPEPTRGTAPFNNIKNKVITALKNTISTTSTLVRKPRICSLGQSDSGKSTNVNYLLNETIVPASYTPMTSVICGLHYIGDRPEFLTGVDNAVVYGRKIINGEVQGDPVEYDDYHVDDKDKILCIGDHKSILNAYGTREGAYYKSEDICIDSIHIFIDNPLLKEVDYYDVPGFGSGEVADDVSLSQKMYQSDIVFYLSQADAFLKGSDIKTLGDMLKYHGKEGLRTVYVMATHSNAIGDPLELEKILDKGAKRLVETLGDEQLENIGISINDYESLRKRFFAFDVNNRLHCQKFNADFEELVPYLVENKLSAADEQLRKASKSYEYTYSKAIQNIDANLSLEEIKGKEFGDQIKIATDKIHKLKDSLFLSIENHKKSCISSFESAYNKIVDEDYIIQKLKDRDVSNNKNEISDFVTYLSNKINGEITSSMKKHSEQFKSEVDKSISDYSALWVDNAGMKKINLDMSGFNFTRAFAAGLSGATAYGALALWASVVAAGSNLGGYILVAKVVSALSAVGISVGGTAAAASAVSAIGGPVVLGVVISIIAAISVWGILSGTWRNKVAKSIIKEFENEHLYGKCTSKINEYWNDTKSAVDSCLRSLNDETIREYTTQNELRAMEDKKVVTESLTQLYTKLITVYGNLLA